MGASGRQDDPASGGRQMPSHWGSRRLNIVTKSSPTGTQFLQAVGLRRGGPLPGAATRRGRVQATRSSTARPATAPPPRASSGRASTRPATASCPSSSSSRTTATRSRCRSRCRPPAAASRSSCARSPTCSCARWTAAIPWPAWPCCARRRPGAARGAGPALVHATVIRPYSHSLSDDETLYRPPREREAEAQRDPLVHLPALPASPRASPREDELAALREEVDREVERGGRRRPAPRPLPDPESATLHVYSPDVDPTSDAFDTRAAAGGRPEDHGRPPQRLPARRDGARPAHRRVRRGRGRLQPRGEPRRGQGQGRRLQGHPQPPAQVRLGARLQLAARRGQHRRPRHRHGHARPEAGGRDPVLRLHLAGVHADPQRAGAASAGAPTAPSSARWSSA